MLISVRTQSSIFMNTDKSKITLIEQHLWKFLGIISFMSDDGISITPAKHELMVEDPDITLIQSQTPGLSIMFVTRRRTFFEPHIPRAGLFDPFSMQQFHIRESQVSSYVVNFTPRFNWLATSSAKNSFVILGFHTCILLERRVKCKVYWLYPIGTACKYKHNMNIC